MADMAHHEGMRRFLLALAMAGCGETPENAPEIPEGQPPPAPPVDMRPAPAAAALPFRVIACKFELAKDIGYYDLAVQPDGTASVVGRVWIGGPMLQGFADLKPYDAAYTSGPVTVADPSGDWNMAADRTQSPVILTVTHNGKTITAACDAR